MYNMVSCIPRTLIVIEISSPLSWTERVREKVMGRSTGIEQERHKFCVWKNRGWSFSSAITSSTNWSVYLSSYSISFLLNEVSHNNFLIVLT